MQKQNLRTLGLSVSAGAFLLASAILPLAASANGGHDERDTIRSSFSASHLGDQIRDLVKKRIDDKKKDICDRFESRFHSRFPWAKGPSFCQNHGGGNQNAPEVSITADPMVVTAGGSSLLNWDSDNATSCMASNGWSGTKSLSGSQSVTVNATTTYSLSCKNAKGTTTESVTVNVIPVVVPPPPAPTVALNASPLMVQVGATSTLTWSSTNASACVASNGWSGSKSLSGNQIATINATTTFTLACGNGMATDTKSVTVNATPVPVAPQPTVTIDADPTHVAPGGTSLLTWNSTNATACDASNGWTGSKTTSGNTVVNPSATTTYTLACGNGTATSTASVTVNVYPTPSLTLTATPGAIPVGDSSLLSWTSLNTTDCTASGSWSGAMALSGSTSVSPTSTATYVLMCNGLGGMIVATTTVTVTPAPIPTLSLNGNPLNIFAGATSTLTWNSTNVTTCTASDGWTGAKATSSNEIVSPLATTTYTLVCGGLGGTATSSVTIGVTPTSTPPSPAPTLTFTGDPLSITNGATSTLAWSTTDTLSCTASNGWSGTKGTSGNEIVSPSSTTTYTLLCSGTGGATSSSVTIGVTPVVVPSQNIGHVVVSEVYYDVGAGKGTEPGNEWVELFNGSSNSVDLNGWKLMDESGSFDMIATSSFLLVPSAYLLITGSSTTAGFWSIPSAIVVLPNTTIGGGLGNTEDSVVLMDAASTTIDAVSWGTATTTSVMVPTVPGAASGHSIGRIQFTADSNTNADWGDFVTPTPGQ